MTLCEPVSFPVSELVCTFRGRCREHWEQCDARDMLVRTVPPKTMSTVSSGGGILTSEEQNDAEVRREDEDCINKFGRLNARLYELRDERDSVKVSKWYRNLSGAIRTISSLRAEGDGRN